MAQRASPKAANSASGYLLFYNVAQCSLWSYVLYLAVTHLVASKSLLHGATSLYNEIGTTVRYIQTLAVLDVVHVAAGLVKSNLPTTTAQVFSRMVLVWPILELFPSGRDSPLYASMVVAWSIAEIVRYTTYATAAMGVKPPLLEYLRYTLFYVLYPVGAGSEALIMLSTCDDAEKQYGILAKSVIYFLFSTWWPALAVMMKHMHAQRDKWQRRMRADKKGKARAE